MKNVRALVLREGEVHKRVAMQVVFVPPTGFRIRTLCGPYDNFLLVREEIVANHPGDNLEPSAEILELDPVRELDRF